jgi:hypothetical protein
VLAVSLCAAAVAAQQTQTTTAATSTVTAAPPPQKEPGDDVSVKRIYLYLGVAGATIGLLLYFWKGMHWAAFTPLESKAGGVRVRELLEGELQKTPKALMELIHKELNNPAGHQAIAGYVVAHWQTTAGADEFRKFVFDILNSPNAEPLMTEIIARYDLRESSRKVSKQSEEVAKKATRRILHEGSLRDRLLEASEIGSTMTPEPAQNITRATQLYIALRAYLDDKAKGEENQPDGE